MSWETERRSHHPPSSSTTMTMPMTGAMLLSNTVSGAWWLPCHLQVQVRDGNGIYGILTRIFYGRDGAGIIDK